MAWYNRNLCIPANKLPNDGSSVDWGRVRGTVAMRAGEWYPCLPTPANVSGQSGFAEAWAETMRKLTGAGHFGFRAEWPKLFVAKPLAGRTCRINL